MDYKNRDFKEISGYLNSLMSDIEVKTSTERVFVRNQAINHLKGKLDMEVKSPSTQGNIIRLTFKEQFTVFDKPINIKIKLDFGVSVKTTGETEKTGRIKVSDVCTVPPKPFKFKRIEAIDASIPDYELIKDEDSTEFKLVSTNGSYSFDTNEVEGIYQSNTISEIINKVELGYKTQLCSMIIQPILKRLFLSNNGYNGEYDVFGRKYINQFLNGANVNEFAEDMVEYGKSKGVIII